MTRKILIVDDDPHIRDVLTFALRKAGMSTVEAEHGAQALERFAAEAPDLVVLDINMPRMDGLEVCRQLRMTSQVPILFLSSRDDEVDRIIGLEVGGDDYVVKPFSPREVVARVNVILKRTNAASTAASGEETVLRRGDLQVDTAAYVASFAGMPVHLTATEFHLLVSFMRHPGKVFSRDNLIDNVYGPGFALSDRTVDSHIRNLRAKFSEIGAGEIIETLRGIGYRLQA